jgi:hypothetical protein
MEKEILQEITRYQTLMGIEPKKPLMNEGAELMAIIRASSSAAAKNLDDLVKIVRKSAVEGVELLDSEIDDLVEYAKSTGKYTEDEIEILRTFFKKPKVKTKISSGNGFRTLDDLVDDITESEAKVLTTLYKLTDDEISSIVSVRSDSFFKNKPKTQWETDLETSIVDSMEKGKNEGKIMETAEVPYNEIDKLIDKKYPVTDNMSPVERAVNEGTRKNLKQRFRESVPIKEKIKELELNGNIKESSVKVEPISDVASSSSKTVKRQVPDPQGIGAPRTEELDELLSEFYYDILDKVKTKGEESLTPIEKEIVESVENWKSGKSIDAEKLTTKYRNQPSKFIYDYVDELKNSTDELTPNEQKLVDALEDFEKNGTEYKWYTLADEAMEPFVLTVDNLGTTFKRISSEWNLMYLLKKVLVPFDYFYTVIFRPTLRWANASFDIFLQNWSMRIKNGTLKLDFDVAAREFTETMGKSFDNYIKSGGNLGLRDIRKMQERLMYLKTYSPLAEGSQIEKMLLEETWEIFKTNARTKVPPENIKDWDTFIRLFESEGEGSLSISTREILGDAPPLKTDPDQTTVKTTFREKIKKAWADGVQSNGKTVLNSLFQKFIDGLGNLVSLVFTGTVLRPKTIQRQFLKYGMTQKNAICTAMSIYAVQKVLLPILGAVVYGALLGLERSEGIKNKYVEKYGTGWGYYWHFYFVDPVIEWTLGNGPVDEVASVATDLLPKKWKDSKEMINKVAKLEIETSWGDFLNWAIEGWGDDIVTEIIELSFVAATEGGDTVEEIAEMVEINSVNQTTIDEYENLQNELKNAEERLKNAKNEQSKNKAKYDIAIANEKINGVQIGAFLNEAKYAINDIFGKGTDAAENMISRLEFVPYLPNDYLERVKKNLKDNNYNVTLKNLANLSSDIKNNTELYTKKIQEEITKNRKGSVLIKGDKDKYLLVVNSPNFELDLTPDEFSTIFDGESVAWVSPSMKNIKPNTERTYGTLKDFYKNMKNL